MVNVYIDGVFDLFHRGHIESIKKCLKFGNNIIVGVVSDNDASSYKRAPIFNENDRYEIIKNLKFVEKVIFPCPLIIDNKFIKDNKIDIIVHGFSNDEDFNKQKNFFKIPIDLGIFRRIEYYDKISTTEIIEKIKSEY